MIAGLVCKPLVLPVGEEPAPFQREVHVWVVFINDVPKICLVLVSVTRSNLSIAFDLDAIGEVHLPLRGEVELRLRPPAARLHAVLPRCSHRQYRFSRGVAKNAES